jgi:hypothetical protein
MGQWYDVLSSDEVKAIGSILMGAAHSDGSVTRDEAREVRCIGPTLQPVGAGARCAVRATKIARTRRGARGCKGIAQQEPGGIRLAWGVCDDDWRRAPRQRWSGGG